MDYLTQLTAFSRNLLLHLGSYGVTLRDLMPGRNVLILGLKSMAGKVVLAIIFWTPGKIIWGLEFLVTKTN